MPARKKKTNKKKAINKDSAANIGYEAELWKMADALLSSMDTAEYKHACLNFLSLKCISDAVAEKRTALIARQSIGADLEVSGGYYDHTTFGTTTHIRRRSDMAEPCPGRRRLLGRGSAQPTWAN